MTYFILLKGKKSKKTLGALAARKGATRSSLDALVRRSLSKRYIAKIITGSEMSVLVKRSRLRALKSVSRKS